MLKRPLRGETNANKTLRAEPIKERSVMTDHFINLNCTSCGGKLDVYDDMERFVCGYCGSAMIVQRRGGTVALKAVTEATRQVQIGTDKTAAELAIVRYEKELTELRRKLAAAGVPQHP